jgi:hypothetical protein
MQNNKELLALLVSATRVSNAMNNNKDLTLLLNNKAEVLEIEKIINLNEELRKKSEIKGLLNSRKILEDQLKFNKGKNANVVKMYETGIQGIDNALNYFVKSLRYNDNEIENLQLSSSQLVGRLERCKTFINMLGYHFAKVILMEEGTLKFIKTNKELMKDVSVDRVMELDKTMYNIRTKLDKVPTTIEELKTFKKEL